MNILKKTRHYGGTKTIHNTNLLNVELCDGKVVGVWFRCQLLPFNQAVVDQNRADDLLECYTSPAPKIISLELEDQVSD